MCLLKASVAAEKEQAFSKNMTQMDNVERRRKSVDDGLSVKTKSARRPLTRFYRNGALRFSMNTQTTEPHTLHKTHQKV